jgi:hypothetical protein
VSSNPKDHYRVHNSSLISVDSATLIELHDIPLCFRFILILSSHPYPCLPTSLFPLGFLTNSVIPSSFPPYVLHARPFYLPSSVNVIHCVYSTNHKGPQCAVFSSNLLPFPSRSQVFPQYPILIHPYFRSCLNLRDQVSHPYKPPLFPCTLPSLRTKLWSLVLVYTAINLVLCQHSDPRPVTLLLSAGTTAWQNVST